MPQHQSSPSTRSGRFLRKEASYDSSTAVLPLLLLLLCFATEDLGEWDFAAAALVYACYILSSVDADHAWRARVQQYPGGCFVAVV